MANRFLGLEEADLIAAGQKLQKEMLTGRTVIATNAGDTGVQLRQGESLESVLADIAAALTALGSTHPLAGYQRITRTVPVYRV